MSTTISVKGKAVKAVEMDRAEFTISLMIKGTSMESVIAEHNGIIKATKDIIDSYDFGDDTVEVYDRSVNFVTETENIKKLFLSKFNESFYGKSAIGIRCSYKNSRFIGLVFALLQDRQKALRANRKANSDLHYGINGNYYISDELRTRVRNELIGEATCDGYNKALAILEATYKFGDGANVKCDNKPTGIELTSANYDVYSPNRYMRAANLDCFGSDFGCDCDDEVSFEEKAAKYEIESAGNATENIYIEITLEFKGTYHKSWN